MTLLEFFVLITSFIQCVLGSCIIPKLVTLLEFFLSITSFIQCVLWSCIVPKPMTLLKFFVSITYFNQCVLGSCIIRKPVTLLKFFVLITSFIQCVLSSCIMPKPWHLEFFVLIFWFVIIFLFSIKKILVFHWFPIDQANSRNSSCNNSTVISYFCKYSIVFPPNIILTISICYSFLQNKARPRKHCFLFLVRRSVVKFL